MTLRNHRIAAVAALTLGSSIMGCRSAVSTHVVPDLVHGGWQTKKLRGVPVTVKVPTHLEVRIIEERYLNKTTMKVFDTSKFVEHEIREKDLLITVDSVRPAAGTLKQSSTFDNKENPQFFSAFNTEIEDETIKDITALLPSLPGVVSNLNKQGAKKGVSASTVADSDGIISLKHLIAVKEFDVNDPCLTSNVQQFLDTYLNNCTQPCPR